MRESPAASMTILAWSSVPAEMLFRHHAASIFSSSLPLSSISTRRGKEPLTLNNVRISRKKPYADKRAPQEKWNREQSYQNCGKYGIINVSFKIGNIHCIWHMNYIYSIKVQAPLHLHGIIDLMISITIIIRSRWHMAHLLYLFYPFTDTKRTKEQVDLI